MQTRIQRIIAFLAAAWRAGSDPQPPPLLDLVDEFPSEDLHESIVRARLIALREGERELAHALEAVLLLHLTGGSLAPIAALVLPETRDEAVN